MAAVVEIPWFLGQHRPGEVVLNVGLAAAHALLLKLLLKPPVVGSDGNVVKVDTGTVGSGSVVSGSVGSGSVVSDGITTSSVLTLTLSVTT